MTERQDICIECIMAWLLFGDGAECLLPHHGKVYWRGASR